MVHWDEEHLHLHVFAVDPIRGRVDHLHPGRVAKEAVNKSGEEKSKARGKRANIAYCDAMRAWQNELHKEVFAPAGLLRVGPGRERWSRREYGRAKALARELVSREKRAAALEAQMIAQERREEGLKAREKVIEGRAVEVARREDEASKKIRLAEAAKANAADMERALDVGSRAVINREIDYRQATEERKEGLVFGPAAPESKKQRERLKDVIQPAYDFLVRFAKKVFKLRRREKAVAEKEAQNRMAAKALADERKRNRQPVPATLAKLVKGERLPLDRDAFPDAFFISHGAKPEKILEALDAMSNTSLRRTWVASMQARQLCDERPDLAADLGRGVKCLEFAARQRGFDLETGQHDPEAAEDPKRARLHVDTKPDSIRVVRRNRQRGRERG